jgi:1-acyl-sn-glycerol-3-phosphate acyltransferase
MARKWEQDEPRLAHRLSKLAAAKDDPMWLLIFPEGTNLSPNTLPKSQSWAKKEDISPHPKHLLLPRTTGLKFCLENLQSTVHWLYDCTIAYEGVPAGDFPQDYYTLRSLYLEGRPPTGVHMYWRKFRVEDIPLDTKEGFDEWLRDRWMEKDVLLDHFYQEGAFPQRAVCVRTEVRLRNTLQDVFSIFSVLALIAVLARIVYLLRVLLG